MSKLNILVSLNSYADNATTNAPSLNHFKWTREMGGLNADNPQSLEYSLAPSETKVIFNGQRVLSQDNTTEYNLFLKAGTPNTYVIKHAGGTTPGFRVKRAIVFGNDTEVAVTISGTVATVSYVSGTAVDFSSAQPGDEVILGDSFALGNRIKAIILAKTASSISFENVGAVAENVVLASVDDLIVQSASGVQKGDKLLIDEGFSAASFNTYEVTGVYSDALEFYSSRPLAAENTVLSEVTVYSSAKRFVYIESIEKANITINNTDSCKIEPIVSAAGKNPGILMLTQNIHSLSVYNPGLQQIVIYIASAE